MDSGHLLKFDHLHQFHPVVVTIDNHLNQLVHACGRQFPVSAPGLLSLKGLHR